MTMKELLAVIAVNMCVAGAALAEPTILSPVKAIPTTVQVKDILKASVYTLLAPREVITVWPDYGYAIPRGAPAQVCSDGMLVQVGRVELGALALVRLGSGADANQGFVIGDSILQDSDASMRTQEVDLRTLCGWLETDKFRALAQESGLDPASTYPNDWFLVTDRAIPSKEWSYTKRLEIVPWGKALQGTIWPGKRAP